MRRRAPWPARRRSARRGRRGARNGRRSRRWRRHPSASRRKYRRYARRSPRRWQSWPPTSSRDPAASRASAPISVAGGQIMASTPGGKIRLAPTSPARASPRRATPPGRSFSSSPPRAAECHFAHAMSAPPVNASLCPHTGGHNMRYIRHAGHQARKNLDFRGPAGKTACTGAGRPAATWKIVMLDQMRRGVTNIFTKLLLGAADRRLRRLGHRRRRAPLRPERAGHGRLDRDHDRGIPAGLPGRNAIHLAPPRPPPHARAGQARSASRHARSPA